MNLKRNCEYSCNICTTDYISLLYNYYNNEKICQVIQGMLLQLFYDWLDKTLPTIEVY